MKKVRKRGFFNHKKIMILFTEKGNPLGLKLLTVANFAKKPLEIKFVTLNGKKIEFFTFVLVKVFFRNFYKNRRQLYQGTKAFALLAAG